MLAGMTMDMTKEQMIEHHKVSMEKMTRLCMVSAKDATECHAEMLKAQEENDTRGGIIDGLVKTIEELKEECGQQEASAEDNEYDLQSLQTDLTSLDEFCEEENIVEYDGVVTYVEKLKEQIKKLQQSEHLLDNQQTVIPENIKKDWMNIWDCLLQEEANCYNQEGHDIEAQTSELEDGYTYTSMRRINEWIS